MKNEDLQVGDFHRSVLMDDMLRVVGVDILTAIAVDGGQSYVRARANLPGVLRQGGMPRLAGGPRPGRSTRLLPQCRFLSERQRRQAVIGPPDQHAPMGVQRRRPPGALSNVMD